MRKPVLIVLFALLLVGCRGQASPSSLPMVDMQIGNRTFHLEIARTEDQQETGLMKRDSMPADHGMIFVFADEKEVAFWMKNTRFPLDIIYMDHLGKVVSIHQMKAYDLTPIYSGGPTQYAIELNVGAAEDAGVHTGDQLQIPPAARAP
jgi:uncharacterized membrane protein (UPF0127 family)